MEAVAVPAVDPIEAEDPIEEDYEEDDKINVDRDISGDGGLKKKILVRGSGWQRPETGDQVEVHYVGTLMDGTKFDSSRDRPEPFSFKLGVGSVIKGWDKGVATMKKGETAILTCRGDYAYGEQGSPPKIPPNATLQFEVELLSWKNSKDISPDDSGGIIKTIVAEGKDWANPGERDEVLVHYKAYVEGTEEPFASSSKGGQEFSVRDGHLVPALPIALQTMKKGEKASLLVLPPFGLGEAGQPPAVPPNATLKVELELVSWKKVEDVTDDGKVVKKTLQEGKETWKRPNEGATVTVRYTGRLPDGTVFDEQEAKTFCLEDGEAIPALELAVAKMHKGERAVVTAEPSYAYGEAGHAGPLAPVPPNTPVTWEVELTDLQNSKEMWEMKDDDEKLATSLAAKDKGNVAFKAGQNERAIKMYKRAIKFVEVDKTKTVSAELKGAFRDARKSAFLNLAAAQLKLGEFKEAIGTCEKVLEVDSGNIKALYRLAQAHLSNGDYIESELAIKRGLQLEERNSDLLALSKKLKVAAREHNQRESKMFAKMFAPSKASAAASPAEPGTDAANGVSAPAAPAAAEAAPDAGAVVDPADLESTADKPDDPTAEAAAAQQ